MEIKPNKKFMHTLIIVLIGVAFYVGLQNLGSVVSGIGAVINVFLPVLVGCMMAFIFNVPMTFFEKQFEKISRKTGWKLLGKIGMPLSLLLTMVLFFIALFFIGNVVFPNLVKAISDIISIVSDNYMKWIEKAENSGIDMSFVKDWLDDFDVNKILQSFKDNSGTILSTAEQAATGVLSVLSNGFIGLVVAIYILLSKKKLAVQAKKILYAFTKESIADEIYDIARLSNKTFSGFISGQSLEAIILGILMFVALSICGFPYAAPIAIVISTTALIPIVGAFIGMIFGIILISPIAADKIIFFFIVFQVVQQIEGNFIYPKVVGNSVGLPGIWTLIAVIVGGKVWGILGMIFFIPLFSVGYAVLRRSVYTRLKNKKVDIDVAGAPTERSFMKANKPAESDETGATGQK